MKVRELIDILNDFYPEEEVTILTDSGRRMQILGVNHMATEECGNLTLRADWSVREGKVIETDEEREARERFNDRETTELKGAKDLIKKTTTKKSVKPKKRGRPKKRRPKLPESPTY